MRYRVGFAYVDGVIVDGPGMPLCLLRCLASATPWSFVIYRPAMTTTRTMNVMKTGASPRPTLLVTAGSGEGRRPGPHVARWVGPEQDAAGCACHGRGGCAGAGDDRGAGRRRVGLAGVPG